MMTIFLGAVASKIGRYALFGGGILLALFVAHKLYSNHYWREGYASCKVDWDASIAAEVSRVHDATDRANDNRVPDPFDKR